MNQLELVSNNIFVENACYLLNIIISNLGLLSQYIVIINVMTRPYHVVIVCFGPKGSHDFKMCLLR